MDNFKHQNNRVSVRLKNWDYRWDAAYFLTICTQDRTHYFGNVEDGNMELSGIGVIADILWYEIQNHSKNVELGEFVVMPNHVHGILILNTVGMVGPVGPVGTLQATSVPPKNKSMAEISPKSGSVSTIIRSYKSAVSKHAHRLGFDFGWQSRFHDHIIRNDQSFQNISQYIINNPLKWQEDKFNLKNKNSDE